MELFLNVLCVTMGIVFGIMIAVILGVRIMLFLCKLFKSKKIYKAKTKENSLNKITNEENKN